jgi:crossover junction endodeoxyribonuclease RuvC
VEGIFYAKNVKSAVTLAHARGVALCTAAQFDLKVTEYKPLSVKEACVGYGRATKEQIHDMVIRLLNLPKAQVQAFDQTDALAVAICHLHTDQINKKISKYATVHV